MKLNMQSLILRTTGNFILPLLLLFSVFLLLRGHNEPGGGFIAGLVAASAICLHMFAMDITSAKRMLRYAPRDLIGFGLIMALLAGVPALLLGQPFLTSQWATLQIPGFGTLKVGTPLVFDIGVYMVVIGSVLTIVFNLAEQEEEED